VLWQYFDAVTTGCRHPSSSDTQLFQRSSGWSADEVARLRHDNPHLREDQHLARWRERIISKACKSARGYINQIFPENSLYAFCRLPQWSTVMPWIAGSVARDCAASSLSESRLLARSAADPASITVFGGPLQFHAPTASSVSVPCVRENDLRVTSAAESDALLKKPSASPCESGALLTRTHHKSCHC
jgi:hypothetical protein